MSSSLAYPPPSTQNTGARMTWPRPERGKEIPKPTTEGWYWARESAASEWREMWIWERGPIKNMILDPANGYKLKVWFEPNLYCSEWGLNGIRRFSCKLSEMEGWQWAERLTLPRGTN